MANQIDSWVLPSEAFDYIHGVIARCVVRNQDLQIPVCLIQDRCQRVANVLPGVVRRHDDADQIVYELHEPSGRIVSGSCGRRASLVRLISLGNRRRCRDRTGGVVMDFTGSS